MRRLVIALLACALTGAAALATPAPAHAQQPAERGTRVERRWPLAPDDYVKVYNFTGRVVVTGWDRDTIGPRSWNMSRPSAWDEHTVRSFAAVGSPLEGEPPCLGEFMDQSDEFVATHGSSMRIIGHYCPIVKAPAGHPCSLDFESRRRRR